MCYIDVRCERVKDLTLSLMVSFSPRLETLTCYARRKSIVHTFLRLPYAPVEIEQEWGST